MMGDGVGDSLQSVEMMFFIEPRPYIGTDDDVDVDVKSGQNYSAELNLEFGQDFEASCF